MQWFTTGGMLRVFPVVLSCALAPRFGVASAQSLSLVHELKGAESSSHAMAFSHDGKVLAGLAYFYKTRTVTVMLWEVKSGKARRTIKVPFEFWALAFAPDGKALAIGTLSQFTGSVQLWDVETGRLRCTLAEGKITHEGRVEGLGPVSSLAFSPNGKELAVGIVMDMDLEGPKYNPGGAMIIDAKTGRVRRHLRTPDRGVTALAFTPSGRTVATGGVDGAVRICSSRTGRLRRTLRGHEGQVSAVAFSADGATITSAGEDGAVIGWDARTGQRRWRRTGVASHGMALSCDGILLATCHDEPLIRLRRISRR